MLAAFGLMVLGTGGPRWAVEEAMHSLEQQLLLLVEVGTRLQ